MTTSEEQLVSDADHVRLSRLVTESAWRVDLGQPDTVYELFVEDGELALDRIYRGRNEIRAWGEALIATNPYPGIRHLTANQRFVATGTAADGRDTAAGTTVLTVFLENEHGRATTLPYAVGEDHDRFVRTADGWRFTHRAWQELFSRD